MKKMLLTFTAMLFFVMTDAQEKFEAFTRQKKSMDLSTGICMSYIDTGNPAGSPVLLLHGYTDTSRSFELLIEELKCVNANIRIIAPDLRGHGDTSMPDATQCKGAPEKCFTPEKLAEDVISLVDHLGIQKMYVVGHSMGSIIAQVLALQYFDRVNSMVLLETFVHGKECDTIQDFLIGELVEKNWKQIMEEKSGIENWPEDVYAITPMSMEEKVKTFLKENWVVESAAAQDFLEAIFPETLSIRLGTWIGAIKALGEIDYRDALAKLKIPTLIIWATQDGVTSPKDQKYVRSAFQSAAKSNQTLIVYKTYGKLPLPESGNPLTELGHNLHWAAPKAVAEDIHSFITTGMPVNNLHYVNPANKKEILTDNISSVEVFE